MTAARRGLARVQRYTDALKNACTPRTSRSSPHTRVELRGSLSLSVQNQLFFLGRGAQILRIQAKQEAPELVHIYLFPHTDHLFKY